MDDGWRWSYEDAHGAATSGVQLVTTSFPTQGDAESWLGEHWREIFASGVAAVTLHRGESVVYGPMLLSAGA